MLDALISAGANLINGFMNRSSQADFNAQQMQLAQQNLAFQREAATHGIQWKVADATAAGLHPLAAMGANTFSPSPVTAGGEAPKFDFGSLGQDLARAAKANQEEETRAKVDAEAARKIELEKGTLQNDILKTELVSRINRTSPGSGQIGPRIPIPREGPRRSATGFAVADDDMKSKEESTPSVNRMPLWGLFNIKTHPGRATGQDLENEYGEYGGGILAAPNIIPDLIHTYGPEGGFSLPSFGGGSGSRVKRFRRGRYTAPSYRPWAE